MVLVFERESDEKSNVEVADVGQPARLEEGTAWGVFAIRKNSRGEEYDDFITVAPGETPVLTPVTEAQKRTWDGSQLVAVRGRLSRKQ